MSYPLLLDEMFSGAITSALSALLDQPAPLQPGQVTFPSRR